MEAKQSRFTKYVSSFILNIKPNNYNLCTTLWGSRRNYACNSEKNGSVIFLSTFSHEIQPSSNFKINKGRNRSTHWWQSASIFMPTRLPLISIDGYDWIAGPIWNYGTGALTPLTGPGTLLNRMALSKSTTGKCEPMKAVKQPVRGTASNTEEQNCFSFQTKYVTPQILQARIAYLQNVIKWTLDELPNIGGLTLKSYFMILSSVT